MPQVFADLFVSVDGHARGTRSPGYFGFTGPELERWIDDEMQRPYTNVMGRRTYTLLSSLPPEARDDGWHQMSRTPTIVFSRTLAEPSWPGATLHAGDAVAEVRRLKTGPGPDLRIVGSLSLVRQLLNAGQVDRLRLMVFPLIIGETGEEPFFTHLIDAALELVSQTVIDNRVVLLDYRPGGPPPYMT